MNYFLYSLFFSNEQKKDAYVFLLINRADLNDYQKEIFFKDYMKMMNSLIYDPEIMADF